MSDQRKHRGATVIPLSQVHADARRVIAEAKLPASFAVVRVNEITCTAQATPDIVLGRHFHPVTNEWFVLARGGFRRFVAGEGTDEQVHESLRAPCLIECPSGVPHTFIGPEPGTILITLADQHYDAQDAVGVPGHGGRMERWESDVIHRARALMEDPALQGHPVVGRGEVVDPEIPFFGRVLHERRQTPAGVLDYYAILRHFGWSVVFGVTTSGEVPTLIQWKHGHNRAGWELPPGGIGKIEEDAPLEAIEARTRATYLAETGYGGGTWTPLGHDIVETGKYRGATPDSHGLRAHYFLAEGLERLRDPNPRPEEQLVQLMVPLAEWPAVLESGLFTEISAVSCAYRALLRLRALRWAME